MGCCMPPKKSSRAAAVSYILARKLTNSARLTVTLTNRQLLDHAPGTAVNVETKLESRKIKALLFINNKPYRPVYTSRKVEMRSL